MTDMLCAALKLTNDVHLQSFDPAHWHELRRGGIGGSDVPKLCGAYGDDAPEWGTPLAVYRSKTEPVEERRELDNVAAAIGTAMEDLLARLYEQTTGLVTVKAPMCCDPARPWRRASVDRLVYDEAADPSKSRPVAVLELKRPTAWNQTWKGDDAPAYARMQGQWYASILGLPRVDIFALVSDTTPRLFSYPADPELAELLTAECETFWEQHVITKEPPLPVASERRAWLGDRYPEITAPMTPATMYQEALAESLQLLGQRQKLLDTRKAEVTDELLQSLRGGEGVKGAGWSFTWRESAGRVAWKALAETLLPQVDDEQQAFLLRQFTGRPSRSPRYNPKRSK